jgi:hypothetical protein
VSVDEAFKAGLASVRESGVRVDTKDIAVLATWSVFEKRARKVEFDPRFEADGPRYARLLILQALMA